MKKILKQVSPRNDYTVYEEGGAYIVAGENQRGQRYECRVVPEAVDYLCDSTRGRNITSERAGGVIAPVADSSSYRTPTATGYGILDSTCCWRRWRSDEPR